MMRLKFLRWFAVFFVAGAAFAAAIEQPLADSAKEQVARELFSALKCVVCEGQSLADSDAKLAVQMRARIRHLVEEGKSREEVLAIFRESYGETILMTPPLAAKTALLWVLPLALVLLGGALIWRYTQRREGSDHG